MDDSAPPSIAFTPEATGVVEVSPFQFAAPVRSSGTVTLRGAVNLVDSGRIVGWAQDLRDPDKPVSLEILVGTQIVAYAVADRYREELRRAGAGSGHHGFEVALPHSLGGTEAVLVRRAEDGAAVEAWPAGVKGRVLCAPVLFDN